MALPSSETIAEHAGTIAGWIAAVVLGALGAIKSGLGVRKGLREDHSGERQQRSEDTVDDAYGEIVDRLRAEVGRLADLIKAMSLELDDERRARREAEERTIAAERRVFEMCGRIDELERQIATLQNSEPM